MLPDIKPDKLADQERAKYNKTWDYEDYREFSPGEGLFVHFLTSVNPARGTSVRDYGVGSGRAALFMKLSGFEVSIVDISYNCLDEHVATILGDQLIVCTLWDLPDDMPVVNNGYCTDVMEHIPPEKVDDVLAEIKRTSENCFFNICFHDDHFGEKVGETLHLTVKPFLWWLDKLNEYGTVKEARDICFTGLFQVEWNK
jgi:hypothetical protein